MNSHPHPFVPLSFQRKPTAESRQRAAGFFAEMNRRRTTRHFSQDPVPRDLVAVSDATVKQQIREAAEAEEHAFYHGRAPQEWIDAIAPLGTDEHKPHLTDAPWVVVLFRQTHGFDRQGRKRPFYYTQESCGIAAGMFITAVHLMGLVTLTHTPNPMAFLGRLLGRAAHEKAMLVMPVGYPAVDATVPDITRKAADEIIVWR